MPASSRLPAADPEPNRSPAGEAIARDHLNVPTLQTRRADGLDFYGVAVWQVRAALEAAYQAGLVAGRRANQERT